MVYTVDSCGLSTKTFTGGGYDVSHLLGMDVCLLLTAINSYVIAIWF
jgi:hypothetical protein